MSTWLVTKSGRLFGCCGTRVERVVDEKITDDTDREKRLDRATVKVANAMARRSAYEDDAPETPLEGALYLLTGLKRSDGHIRMILAQIWETCCQHDLAERSDCEYVLDVPDLSADDDWQFPFSEIVDRFRHWF